VWLAFPEMAPCKDTFPGGPGGFGIVHAFAINPMPPRRCGEALATEKAKEARAVWSPCRYDLVQEDPFDQRIVPGA
jgi:hypothetical protein